MKKLKAANDRMREAKKDFTLAAYGALCGDADATSKVGFRRMRSFKHSETCRYDRPLSAKTGRSQHLIARSICVEKSDHPLLRYVATAPDPIWISPVLRDRANPPHLETTLS